MKTIQRQLGQWKRRAEREVHDIFVVAVGQQSEQGALGQGSGVRSPARRGDRGDRSDTQVPLPGAAFEPAAFAQRVVGSDHRGAADRERLRQRSLRGQPDAGMNRALADGLRQPAGKLLLQRTGSRRPRAQVRGELVRIHQSPILPESGSFIQVHFAADYLNGEHDHGQRPRGPGPRGAARARLSAGVTTRRVSPAAGGSSRSGAVRWTTSRRARRPVLRARPARTGLGSPATVATAGGRFFGFVNGAALPASVAATWLASAWDQNAALRVMSPAAAAIEDVALGWVRDVLGLPRESGGAVVTGATMANFTGLAAARHALLERAGWDVEKRRPLPRAATDGRGRRRGSRITVLKALGMLGLGRKRVVRVPADDQGRMLAAQLPPSRRPDDRLHPGRQREHRRVRPRGGDLRRAREARAWVHVDGAFGLWAAASPMFRHLTQRASNRRIPGRSTATNGRTWDTTAEWRSCGTPPLCGQRWPSWPRT